MEKPLPRILIVDDEKDIVEFLAMELSRRDFEVDTALSGEEAIEKIKENRPHLMLLDVRMPGMGGIETLRQAKQLDPRIGVIMVTAVHEEEIARSAIALGAHDYITKPIDFTYLNMVVMTKIIDMLG
ncbi:MAG: response regulator [Candidatus Tectomicrobia bacterium]|uniref:Response regulator n=1 Tax=Tectimicrobiota bacterium TaxID=2528274 RepID=A0A932MQB4_UNCTE|nr:response regulator [Candidatus Tectomicrobia bacterium]